MRTMSRALLDSRDAKEAWREVYRIPPVRLTVGQFLRVGLEVGIRGDRWGIDEVKRLSRDPFPTFSDSRLCQAIGTDGEKSFLARVSINGHDWDVSTGSMWARCIVQPIDEEGNPSGDRFGASIYVFKPSP